MARDPSAGVTMIEMLVAVAIFALIGAAGFSVLDTMARTDRALEGRLDRLSQRDLVLRLFVNDMARATGYRFETDRNALALTVSGGVVTYLDGKNGLQRVVALTGRPPLTQGLLPLRPRWELGNAAGDWRPAKTGAQGMAVALVLGPEGLRKLARLPQRPRGRE